MKCFILGVTALLAAIFVSSSSAAPGKIMINYYYERGRVMANRLDQKKNLVI